MPRTDIAPLVAARRRIDPTYCSVTLPQSASADIDVCVAACLTSSRERLRLGIIFDRDEGPSETSVPLTRLQALELIMHLTTLMKQLPANEFEADR